MSKKFLSVFLALVMMLTGLSAYSLTADAASYATELRNAGFPESYIDSLVALHNKYPHWVFKPLKTGLNWSTAVAGERSSHSDQQLESGYGSEYYCTCSRCSSSGRLRNASEWAVEHFMDPRNWLDEQHVFQFESTEYNAAHTQTGVESILSGTFMKNANITYLDGYGNTQTYKDGYGDTVKYSAAILQAAKKSNLSAYYIAGRIVKEIGSAGKPTASGTVGNRAPFNGIYNYYSIGASSSGTQGLEWASGFMKTSRSTTLYNAKTAVSAGQRLVYIGESTNYYYVKLYTKSGSGYSGGAVDWILKSDCNTQYFTYERPWTNPYKAIVGGAEYIAASYAKQYTPYLQKFNVNPNSSSLYGHEYMTNVDAVSIEAVSTYKAYKNAGQLADAKTFYIPVFNNMPADTKTYGQWKQVNGKWYYYQGGDMVTGWLKLGNVWYYLNASGVMQTGWQKLSGKWYYFNPSGSMRTGWLKDDGKWYYLNDDGKMVTFLNKIGSKYYYFSGSGAMYTGWLTIKEKKWYFTDDGAATGFLELDGKWYYFNADCTMHTGWLKDDGKWYFFGEDGVMVKYRQRIAGNDYYFTGAGVMKTGWLKIGATWYYYLPAGNMKKNGWAYINKVYYYFNENGAMLTGWLELDDGKYYLNTSGAMLKYSQTIDGKDYYFNASGRMQKGFVTSGGKRYYYGEDGVMVKYRQTIDGKLYYFNGKGEMMTGWLTISGNQYYFGSDGAAVTGEQTIGGKTYTFDENGVLQA